MSVLTGNMSVLTGNMIYVEKKSFLSIPKKIFIKRLFTQEYIG